MLGLPEGNLANRPTEFPLRSVPLLGPAGQGPAHRVLELLGVPLHPRTEREEGRTILAAEQGVVGMLSAGGGNLGLPLESVNHAIGVSPSPCLP
jgi:hypothetical protein